MESGPRVRRRARYTPTRPNELPSPILTSPRHPAARAPGCSHECDTIKQGLISMSQTGSSATYSYTALRGTPTREGATLLGSTEVHDRAPSSSTSRTAPVAALGYQQTGDQSLVALLAQLQAGYSPPHASSLYLGHHYKHRREKIHQDQTVAQEQPFWPCQPRLLPSRPPTAPEP